MVTLKRWQQPIHYDFQHIEEINKVMRRNLRSLQMFNAHLMHLLCTCEAPLMHTQCTLVAPRDMEKRMPNEKTYITDNERDRVLGNKIVAKYRGK